MKILHVNHLLDPISGGGTAERTVQLARFLSQQGIETGILTLNIGDTGAYEKQLGQTPIFKLPCINRRYYIHATWPWHIHKIVSQFDVVHLMGHWTLLNAIVALICVRLGKPYVVCPAGALKSFGRSRKLKKFYDLLVGRWVIKNAHAWISITEDEKKDFSAYGISPELVEVIPNGIDPQQYLLTEPIASLPVGLEEKIGRAPFFLFLGRLNAIKGPDLLLEAFIQIADRFPKVHLVFAGPDSGMLEQLQTMAEQSQVKERIHFCGYIGGRDKIKLLQNAYCLAIPSRNEAMSVVVLEAGICGTPVLFTDKCGLQNIFEADAGLMVEAAIDGIVIGLGKALGNEKESKRRSERLQEIVLKEYLWQSQAMKYQNLYRGILEDV